MQYQVERFEHVMVVPSGAWVGTPTTLFRLGDGPGAEALSREEMVGLCAMSSAEVVTIAGKAPLRMPGVSSLIMTLSRTHRVLVRATCPSQPWMAGRIPFRRAQIVEEVSVPDPWLQADEVIFVLSERNPLPGLAAWSSVCPEVYLQPATSAEVEEAMRFVATHPGYRLSPPLEAMRLPDGSNHNVWS